MMRLALVLLAATLAACAHGVATDDTATAALPEKPDVGFRAPTYSAVSFTGDSVSLATYRGKVVLLNAWATWCGPCRQEIPELRALHERYSKDGLVVVGVTVDAEGTESQVDDFVKEFRMAYPLWRDPAERISAQYAIMGLPATFLIDRRGVIRWKSTGAVAPCDTALERAIHAALGTS